MGYFLFTRSIPSVITIRAVPCTTLFVIFPGYSLVSSAPYTHCNCLVSLSLTCRRFGYRSRMPLGNTISSFLKVRHLYTTSSPPTRLFNRSCPISSQKATTGHAVAR